MFRNTTLSAAALAAFLGLPAAQAAEADLQKEVEALKAQNREIMERLEATAEALDQMAPARAAARRMPHAHGTRGTTVVGAYGELHYNNLSDQIGIGGKQDQKEIDFHRFILFLGHEFNDRIRFWSELEVEHSKVDAGGGEVAIEQAYVEFDVTDETMIRAGILLVPAGLINETHEPPTFYGVERNPIAKYIIPTTWREGGVSVVGRLGNGFSYDLLLHSGLKLTNGGNYAVRAGRQAVCEAPADDPAVTARVKWTAVPGLELALAVQRQTDAAQGTDPQVGGATLVAPHVVWQKGRFGLRAVYASWDIEGSGPAGIGADEQTGWYVEPSFRINDKWGVFARYNTWDNQAGNGTDTEYSQLDVGFNFWPHPDVVIKVDYQDQSVPPGSTKELDGINIGVGYQF